ncbi:MAG: 3'-5' exonuclease domain-containing protein 2, partial [Kiritimatiellae bacterium]|nr:3'-5' exonuclease domain-containing protein 2 [Kiritimatiellia bacterium]
VHDDIRGLQKLHDFVPAGFVDLQKIVWEWGIRDKAVKKMAAIILGYRISKTHQIFPLVEDSCRGGNPMCDGWLLRSLDDRQLVS